MKRKKLKLYLDNSVISMYYDNSAPELMEITQKFWDCILPDFEVFISELTLREIGETTNIQLRKALKNLIIGFGVLKETEEVLRLGKIYVSKRRIPFADALHLAYASLEGINYFVTWNRKHLYRRGTQKMLNEVNLALRISIPLIITPEKFFEEV